MNSKLSKDAINYFYTLVRMECAEPRARLLPGMNRTQLLDEMMATITDLSLFAGRGEVVKLHKEIWKLLWIGYANSFRAKM